jgi:lipopolysaccharide biosynthesis regulator YciM
VRGILRRLRGGAPRPLPAGAREDGYRRALLAALERDLAGAEQALVHLARADSTDFDAHRLLGRLYCARGEIGRAIRVHQNLLLRTDLSARERVDALADLAADFQRGGFVRRAIAAYDEVVAHDPKHVAAHRALVRLLVAVREFPRALDCARRLARLEGRAGAHEQAGLLVEMAQAAHAEGRSSDARKALRRALRLDRTSVRAWAETGALEAERGRTRAALAAWKRAAELDPAAAAPVYPRLEAAFAGRGRARDYEAFLREQLLGRPGDAAATLALARALAARGEVDEAVGLLRGLLEREPERVEAYTALGRILLAAGREAEALKAYEETLGVLERSGLEARESSA